MSVVIGEVVMPTWIIVWLMLLTMGVLYSKDSSKGSSGKIAELESKVEELESRIDDLEPSYHSDEEDDY